MNMYFVKRYFLRKLFKIMKKTPLNMPTVRYWKTKDAVQAKVYTNKDGALVMKMDGEDYEFPGFPRSHLLYGPLSKLKHEIKNQIFNESWRKLEEGMPKEEILRDFRTALDNIFQISESLKYEMIPPTKMFKGVREIWRAMTVLEKNHPECQRIEPLKKTLTFIMSDDDAYRMRVQWIIQIFNPSAWWFKLLRDPIKDFELGLQELEHAEVVSDMKERIRLLRRILLFILEDEKIKQLFLEFCKEVDWNKLKLTKADKYHFRAKYFKVDMDLFEY